MSSGVEADIALDAAVVLSLGMNRVLGRTAGLAGRGAEALAALAAGRAEARAAALAEAETYDRALREVLDRNARIAALAETKTKIGAKVPLPAPLELEGAERPLDELTAWCAATDTALDEAERRLSRHLAAEVSAQIFTAPAEGLRTDTGHPGTPPKPEPEPDRDLAHVHQALERVLTRLLPDATAEDRRSVAEAARLLAETTSPGEAEGVLTEIRLRVQKANEHTRRRRDEERRRAAEREAAEQAEAERRYVLDSITSAFEDLGYEVRPGFETLTAQDGTITLTRGNWPDHSIRMRVDGSAEASSRAELRAKMTRTRAAMSDDDRRLDAEREREWCETFEAARERLASAGVHADVTWRLEPGVHELPVTAESRQTRARTERRERRREREQ